MAASKGNQYWQFREKHGRGFKYTPETFWEEAVKYFEWISTQDWIKKEAIKGGDKAGSTMNVPIQKPMCIGSFCLFLDIDDNTFYRYEKEEGYEDFWEIARTARRIIESNQFEGATVGIFNANIIARKLGLGDKKIVEGGDTPIQIRTITKEEAHIITKELKDIYG